MRPDRLVMGRGGALDHTDDAFCPRFHYAVELVGKRWNGAILRALLYGASRWSELRSVIPSLTDRMLSERLKELESEGLVQRTVVPETPVRVQYHLTERGRDLERVVAALQEWADDWVAADGTPRPGPEM